MLRGMGGFGMEQNDVYDKNRRRTGRVHVRGTPWRRGDYGLVVCTWVYDGDGHLLLTKRAPEKTYAGTWENSGGAAKAGETSRQAIARELFEETGIRAGEEEFEYLCSGWNRNTHFDFYCLRRQIPLQELRLLPGETVDAVWASFSQVHEMIAQKKICKVIARQFLRQEPMLLARQRG